MVGEHFGHAAARLVSRIGVDFPSGDASQQAAVGQTRLLLKQTLQRAAQEGTIPAGGVHQRSGAAWPADVVQQLVHDGFTGVDRRRGVKGIDGHLAGIAREKVCAQVHEISFAQDGRCARARAASCIRFSVPYEISYGSPPAYSLTGKRRGPPSGGW